MASQEVRNLRLTIEDHWCGLQLCLPFDGPHRIALRAQCGLPSVQMATAYSLACAASMCWSSFQ